MSESAEMKRDRELAMYVDKLVDSAPPLGPDQRAAIRRIFGGQGPPPELISPFPLGPKRPPAPERTALYRRYDANGVLLYVGISNNPATRTKQHRSVASWHKYEASYTAVWFDSRDEALDAEVEAIINEKPVFNVANNYGRAERLAAYLGSLS